MAINLVSMSYARMYNRIVRGWAGCMGLDNPYCYLKRQSMTLHSWCEGRGARGEGRGARGEGRGARDADVLQDCLLCWMDASRDGINN
jgi:hypothetical protein